MTTPGGARTATRLSLRRLQPERPRPHHRRAYSVRGTPEGIVSAPLRWDEIDDANPKDFTIATVPARFAALGDLHADIDDHVFGSISSWSGPIATSATTRPHRPILNDP